MQLNIRWGVSEDLTSEPGARALFSFKPCHEVMRAGLDTIGATHLVVWFPQMYLVNKNLFHCQPG